MSRIEHSEHTPPADRSRRTFLGATLAAPALVVPAHAIAGSDEAPPERDEPGERGYHVTDRIRTYYRLARF